MTKFDWEKANRKQRVAWTSQEVAEAHERGTKAAEEAGARRKKWARRVLDAVEDGRVRYLREGDTDRVFTLLEDEEHLTLRMRGRSAKSGIGPAELRTSLSRWSPGAGAKRPPGFERCSNKVFNRYLRDERSFQAQLELAARRLEIEPVALWKAIRRVAADLGGA